MNMHTHQTKRESGELVAKDDALIIKAVREKSREVDFVASTGDLDSHGDIIDQGSWDLSHFKQNPIVLYGHDAKELPIGMCTSVGVTNGQLECTIRFAKTQRADEVLDLVRDDVLRAVSVGFTPVNGGYEVVNGKEAWVLRNAILKEISVVPIGSNPHALAKALVLSSKGDRIQRAPAGTFTRIMCALWPSQLAAARTLRRYRAGVDDERELDAAFGALRRALLRAMNEEI